MSGAVYTTRDKILPHIPTRGYSSKGQQQRETGAIAERERQGQQQWKQEQGAIAERDMGNISGYRSKRL
jgi:hypothetical protein